LPSIDDDDDTALKLVAQTSYFTPLPSAFAKNTSIFLSALNEVRAATATSLIPK
jgi:hypothetical protein